MRRASTERPRCDPSPGSETLPATSCRSSRRDSMAAGVMGVAQCFRPQTACRAARGSTRDRLLDELDVLAELLNAKVVSVAKPDAVARAKRAHYLGDDRGQDLGGAAPPPPPFAPGC